MKTIRLLALSGLCISLLALGATNLGSITESGVSATNAAGVLYPATVTKGAALFQVGSGTYRFSAPVRF
jgi:hypothetical protein